MISVLDLFSGIGGFSLGLERTGGFRTAAFCEIDPYCRRVLAKHWPGVPIYDDIRTLTAARLAADGIGSALADAGHLGCDSGAAPAERQTRAGRIDLICGGFPCQDISTAGTGAGIAGERSGLWSEYARLVGEVRPRLVIVENVAALLGRGLGRVLGDLAALGYDAEWHCIPAAAVGAPHRRDRVWIIADAESARCPPGLREADTLLDGHQPGDGGFIVADPGLPRLPLPERGAILSPRRWTEGRAASERGWWIAEPDVGRVAHGIRARVDRLRGLGNAVVPQIPELIGRAILTSMQMELTDAAE